MIDGQKIVVVIPAYNVQGQIKKTICGIPDYVDAIIVVDDKSQDKTLEIIQQMSADDNEPKLIVVSVELQSRDY